VEGNTLRAASALRSAALGSGGEKISATRPLPVRTYAACCDAEGLSAFMSDSIRIP
jgi:hypothetical protein